MNITILGTGIVGQVLATKLSALGHEVCMATRDPETTRMRTEPNFFSGVSFSAWHAKHPEIPLVPFSALPEETDLLINATAGSHSLEALEAAGDASLQGRILLDLANPLDFSRGMPPTLTVCNTDSLGEQLQRRFPQARVVKGLNTLNYQIMVAPEIVPGEHQLFLCGNDPGAKRAVVRLLGEMGWPEDRILDLGGIQASRGTEMLIPFSMALMMSQGTPLTNFRVERP